MSDTISRKVKPQSGGGVPPGMMLIGGLLGVGLLIVGAIIAASDSGTPIPPTPTTIPAPLVDGVALAEDTTLFVTQDTPFSVLAASDSENTELIAAACATVLVYRNSNDGNYFYYDSQSDVYWVYAQEAGGANGWLPLQNLSATTPTGCND